MDTQNNIITTACFAAVLTAMLLCYNVVYCIQSNLSKMGLYNNWTIIKNNSSSSLPLPLQKLSKSDICESNSVLDPKDVLDCPQWSRVANNTIFQALCLGDASGNSVSADIGIIKKNDL